jgi:hypothetical protein
MLLGIFFFLLFIPVLCIVRPKRSMIYLKKK